MNGTHWRSAGAVAAGLATIVVLSNGTDTILETTGVLPSIAEQRADGLRAPWMLLMLLAYRALFAFGGGALTAHLAPRSPKAHVTVLVAIGAVLGLAGAAATWGTTPAWFSLAVVALTPLVAWLGGRRVIAAPATGSGRLSQPVGVG